VATNFYYVYAIKDTRSTPAKPFYIGKGTGSRAYDHLVTPDQTRKYVRIKEILDGGGKPLIDILVDDLTEAQALRIEAELIAALGTEEMGGQPYEHSCSGWLGWKVAAAHCRSDRGCGARSARARNAEGRHPRADAFESRRNHEL